MRIKLSNYNTYVFTNDTTAVFDSYDLFVGERQPDVSSNEYMTAKPINAISIITQGLNSEIASFETTETMMATRTTMRCYDFEGSTYPIVSQIQGLGRHTKLLQRDGMLDNLKFTQLIFIFPVEFSTHNLMANLCGAKQG